MTSRRDFCATTIAAVAGTGLLAGFTLGCSPDTPHHLDETMTTRRAINPYPAPSSYAPAHEVAGAKRILFVSGQVPEAQDGSVPTDFTTQCRLAWANVIAQLEAAGMSLDHLAKFTVFVADRRYLPEERAVRRELLRNEVPPAMTVIVADIYDPAWLLEIEAIAVA